MRRLLEPLSTYLFITHCVWAFFGLLGWWQNFIFKKIYIQAISLLQAHFQVTYSVVIFIHGKMSIFDNSLLFSMKREHHCLNMEKAPFSTLEVNDSIFKLISEEKEVCKFLLSCCFYKVHYLKIMNSKVYRTHEILPCDIKKKE